MSFAYQDPEETIILRVPADPVISIPQKVTQISGSSVNDNAFVLAKLLVTKVIFPTGSCLKTISKYSFYECSELKELNLRECTKLEEINEFAFSGCESITSIYFPDGVLRTLGEGAFERCQSLETLYLPKSIETTGRSVFSGCTNLRIAEFHKESIIQGLNFYVFHSCPNLESIFIPKSMTGTFNNIFGTDDIKMTNITVDKDNTQYTSVDGVVYTKQLDKIYFVPTGKTENYTILDSVIEIAPLSFESSHIRFITLPPNLITIGSWAFSSASIEEIILPESTKYIQDNAFYLSKLKKFSFPTTVHTIGVQCFFSNTQLEEIKMPDHYEVLGGGAFAGCNNIKRFIYSENSELRVQEQNLVYSKDDTSIIISFDKLKTLTIKSRVTSIGNAVFYENSELTTIVFEPDSHLEVINSLAFAYTGLKELILPPTVTFIGNNAFYGCQSLKKVEVIGNKLTQIDFKAFYNCYNLETVSFEGQSFTISYTVFYSCQSLINLNLGNVKTIGKQSFSLCKNLTTVTLPSSLTSLDEYVFAGSGLKQVIFTKDAPITDIPVAAFSECRNLETVVFSDHITKFCSSCFEKTKICNFEVPALLYKIENLCFNDCQSLETFTIPVGSQLSVFGFRVFAGCYQFREIINKGTNLKVINGALYDKDAVNLFAVPPNLQLQFFAFPESLRVIRQSALLHCVNIKQIFVPPNSVTKIENNAFEDCFNLVNINFPNSVINIGREAFLNCKKLQCGLFIENQEKEYISNLINVALLPKKCTEECREAITCDINNLHINSFRFALISILISVL